MTTPESNQASVAPTRYDMSLNDKGQCFNCLIKPLVYKRPGHYFCHRCSRSFDLKTGHFIANWAWDDEYLPSELAARAEPKLKEYREDELQLRRLDATDVEDSPVTGEHGASQQASPSTPEHPLLELTSEIQGLICDWNSPTQLAVPMDETCMRIARWHAELLNSKYEEGKNAGHAAQFAKDNEEIDIEAREDEHKWYDEQIEEIGNKEYEYPLIGPWADLRLRVIERLKSFKQGDQS